MRYLNSIYALISGILLWLSWPTYGFPALLFIAFVPLLLADYSIRKSNSTHKGRKLLLHAYLCFVIWNFATTSWLYYASGFGMWFAVLVNSLLMTLVVWLYHLIARKTTQNTALSFLVFAWISLEYMHLHWEFSWPWLNLGNGFSEYTTWIQWYEYTGALGGTLWVLLVNVIIYKIVLRFRESVINTAQLIKQLIQPVLIIIIPITCSLIIYYNQQNKLVDTDPINVLVIQPNIDPYTEKYNITNNNIVNLIADLSQPHLSNQLDLIITPETVLADNIRIHQINHHPAIIKLKSQLASYPNINYLGGVSLIDVFTDQSKATKQTNLAPDRITYYNDYNSAMFINQQDTIGLYHKSKLVVGIENFPYKSILKPIIGDAMIDLGGTVASKTTQDHRSVFTTTAGVKAAPIICYESVYGEYVTEYVRNHADILAIITNDAWWGNTQGHQQHLSLARLRAIENRRWIARSANTGISAVIDHTGQIIDQLDYDQPGVINASLEIHDQITFYSKYGDYIARIAVFMTLFIALFAVTRRRD